MISTKRRNRFLIVGLVSLWLVVWTIVPFHRLPAAQAASGDTMADRVLGQSNFTGSAANNMTDPGAKLWDPTGLATDPTSGRLFVSDSHNHRVLSWPDAASFGNGQAADLVIGQQDFTNITANAGGAVSAKTLNTPMGVAVDGRGNLYVADYGNSRVLEYDAPLSSGMAAKRVWGQPDFTSSTANNGGISGLSLNFPWAVALDPAGDLFIADYANKRVLEYVHTLEDFATIGAFFGQTGTDTNSSYNGVISANSLSRPTGLAVDGSGNLYVADMDNHRVLEYNAPFSNTTADRVYGQGGVFTTGTANKGGSPSADNLNYPMGLAWDPAGNLYVADRGNNRVLEFDNPLANTTADRVIGQGASQTNFSGNVSGTGQTGLYWPNAVLVDHSRDLLIADSGNNRVLEYDTPIANTAPFIGSLGPSSTASEGGDFNLVVNGGNFVFPAVVQWNGSARTTTFISSSRLIAGIPAADIATKGTAAVAIANPGGSVSAPQTLTIYASTPLDTIADRVLGQPNFTTNKENNAALLPGGRFFMPLGAAIDPHSGRLFVVDSGNDRVLSWSSALDFTNGSAAQLVLGQSNFLDTYGGPTATSLATPQGIAVDADGRVYVADSWNNRIIRYSPDWANGMAADLVIGQPDFTSGLENNGGLSPASLWYPGAVAFDRQGNLYVADSQNNRVLEYEAPFSNHMAASRVFGQPDFTSNDSHYASPTAATLNHPSGLSFDPWGNLYVADDSNNRVLEYDNPLAGDTVADRVFGQTSFTTNTYGCSEYALEDPYGVALDSAGNLYVADLNNNRVLEYDRPLATDNVADRVFGQPDLASNTINNGGISASSLYNPYAVILDRNNNLLVVDKGNNRVLEYDTPLAVQFKVYLPGVLRGYAGGW